MKICQVVYQSFLQQLSISICWLFFPWLLPVMSTDWKSAKKQVKHTIEAKLILAELVVISKITSSNTGDYKLQVFI